MRRWRPRTLSLLISVSLLGTAFGIPSRALGAEPTDKQTDVPAPVKFEPGKINRTPVGGPIPESGGEGLKVLGPSPLKKVAEVVERRTEDLLVGSRGAVVGQELGAGVTSVGSYCSGPRRRC